ncbi:MAG: hypothetical protein NUV61_01155 [Candidatus Azambacteria bacterium]|nr:hypothetical protein [Candidatus Azambacteria bacterium]
MNKFAAISRDAAGIFGLVAFYFLLTENLIWLAVFVVPSFVFLGGSMLLQKKKHG